MLYTENADDDRCELHIVKSNFCTYARLSTLTHLSFCFLILHFNTSMTTISKEVVRKALASGDYSLHPKSDSNSAEWWSVFDRIHDNENKPIPFVQCRRSFRCFLMIRGRLGRHHSAVMRRAVVS